MKHKIPQMVKTNETQHKYSQFQEKEGIQHKIPQLKVHTDIRCGTCTWDPNCEKYWCY